MSDINQIVVDSIEKEISVEEGASSPAGKAIKMGTLGGLTVLGAKGVSHGVNVAKTAMKSAQNMHQKKLDMLG